MTPLIDQNDAKLMLNFLGQNESFTFQTFDDSIQKNIALTKVYNGNLNQCFSELLRLNEQGAGVFVTVNQTDGKGRKKENITHVRALFVDFDTVDMERAGNLINLDLPPNMIIESSKGKHHAYWVVDKNSHIPLDQFTALQKRLIAYFIKDGADKAIHDLPRVMRLAGFKHQKGEAFTTRIEHIDNRHYTADEVINFVQSLPIQEIEEKEKPITHKVQPTLNTGSIIPLSFEQAKSQANGRWHEIFSKLGYQLPTNQNEHAPCPMCGGKDRFRFDNQGGNGTFICGQGAERETVGGDGFDLLAHGGMNKAQALQAVNDVLASMGLICQSDKKVNSNIVSPLDIKQWGEPKPIKSELLPVKKLTPDMLPIDLHAYCSDEALRADNMTPDFIAVCLITSLGALIGSRVAIKPKQLDDYSIVPNLWGGLVAPPSSKKSPAIKAGTRHLDRLVVKANKQHEEANAEFIADNLIKKAEVKNLQKSLDRMEDSTPEQQKEIALKIATLQSGEDRKPTVKRYFTNDSTPEALAELERSNPNGILVIRDELVGWLSSLDQNDTDTGRAFYLEGWNGTGSYQFDRIMRGSGFIKNHCLSILGGIQPDKLMSYLEKTIKGMGNDGLLQRFQLLVYPDLLQWRYVDQAINKDAREAVFSLFKSIDGLTDKELVRLGAKPKDDFNNRPYFRFTEEAQELYKNWSEHINSQTIPNEEHTIIQEHLSKFGKLMPSLALIFHIVDCVQIGSYLGGVSKNATEMAIQWCDYLESHARRIYGLVLDSANHRATTLSNKLKGLKTDDDWIKSGFTARQIAHKGWKDLATVDKVTNALEVLIEYHWVIEKENRQEVGRPSIRYYLNPEIFIK